MVSAEWPAVRGPSTLNPGAPMMVDTKLPPAPPLIILCTPRSYSSVICAMLGRHPQMYSFPELNLFIAATVGDLLHIEELQQTHSGQPVAWYSAGLVRALAELEFGGQTVATYGEAATWLHARRHWSTHQVLDSLLERIQPRVGVDKSPNTALSPLFLERAREYYPQARFMHLTRHPATAQQSMMECDRLRPGSRNTFGRNSRELANYTARLWCYLQQVLLEFTRNLPPGQTMRLRGEDVLRDPETHLARITAWLGLRIDAAAIEAMKHPEHSPYAGVGPGAYWAENDPTFLAHPRLRPVEAPPPLHVLQERDLDPVVLRNVLELAAQMGYS